MSTWAESFSKRLVLIRAQRAKRNAEREAAERGDRIAERTHDAIEASEASAPSDWVERFQLAAARRRGLAPLAPPPPQPTPVLMTAEGIIAAGRKARGESA